MSSGGADAHTEIEAKFDVGMDTPVPELTGAKSIVSASAPELTHPVSTYFDTPDLDLARRRITVRRRTGSSDAGWHIKMPVSSDERLELRSPLSAGGNTARVPAEVADRVTAHVRGKPLVPVASIETRRIVTVVATKRHQTAAELCDDTVTARNLLDDTTVRWREWEVELLDGDRRTLEKVSTYLLSHGADPGSSPSKLARALGSRLADLRTGDATPDGTAGSALLAALATDVSALLAADPRVRENDDDAVHAMRVATRRLRSVLRSYRDLLDRPSVDAVRSELSWLADILGTARDAEVLAARYDASLSALPSDAVRGPVVETLVGTQRRLYTLAHEEIVRELSGERYFALLDALDALLAAPTVGPSDGRADKRLPEGASRPVPHDRPSRGSRGRAHRRRACRGSARRAQERQEAALRGRGSGGRTLGRSSTHDGRRRREGSEEGAVRPRRRPGQCGVARHDPDRSRLRGRARRGHLHLRCPVRERGTRQRGRAGAAPPRVDEAAAPRSLARLTT
ncbi:CHAD domain-containing protein [Rhodococcus sp. SORGH_AS 301]|nr:CHAD domain-containing protein [Rhodococcus sp. SORGH_AS_0301]MDQ1179793.1 CHAD domain-containing protein [Rhodococcus sp. SORGH_AS_0301]